MKIWRGFGSEHSMNLVMIGRFKDAKSASQAKAAIDELMQQVRQDEQQGRIRPGDTDDRYTDGIFELLRKIGVHDIGPSEMQQFAYDFSVEQRDAEVVLTTEESDFSAFLKVMLSNGAKIEVYSAHEYRDTGYGR